MSSSTTMMNLVYVNWRRYDQMPIMIRRAWPAYCLRIDTTAMRYEHASGGRKKSTISGKTLRRIGTNTSLSAIASTEGSSNGARPMRSEEHTSELQSLMRSSYVVFCLKKKKTPHISIKTHTRQEEKITVKQKIRKNTDTT